MTLQRLTVKPEPAADDELDGCVTDELGERALSLLCKLYDETSRVRLDPTVVAHLLQDLDLLVSDFRRKHR